MTTVAEVDDLIRAGSLPLIFFDIHEVLVFALRNELQIRSQRMW